MKPAADGFKNLFRLGKRNPAVNIQAGFQRLPVHIFKHQIQTAFGFYYRVNFHNARVAQQSHHARFRQKLLPHIRTAHQFRADTLNSHFAFKHFIIGFVHFPHAAFPNLAHKIILFFNVGFPAGIRIFGRRKTSSYRKYTNTTTAKIMAIKYHVTQLGVCWLRLAGSLAVVALTNVFSSNSFLF